MATISSVLIANKIHAKNFSQLFQLTKRLIAPAYTTLVGPIEPKLLTQPSMGANFDSNERPRLNVRLPNRIQVVGLSTASTSDDLIQKKDSPVGNPSFDLFYNTSNGEDCRTHLEHLLPLAWSRNPLTAVKLIFNLREYRESRVGALNGKGFYMAAVWLHQNHPKTLVFNLESIASRPFGSLRDLAEILNLLLEGQDVSAAVEMYERDPDYKLLHDRVSDLFVECLKSDIEKLKKHKLKQPDINHYDYDQYCSEITEAAYCCLDKEYSMDFLCENIAKKIFPRESYPGQEADYEKTVQARLREEVLVPLNNAFNSASENDPGKDAFCLCGVDKYVEEVKAGKSKIAADALLPHEIIGYVNDFGYGQVAEVQWKALVEDMLKQGKMKNFLAVCDLTTLPYEGLRSQEISMALTILMSELSEEPWKGKVINYKDTRKGWEDLHLIALPGDELRNKYDFVKEKTMDVWNYIKLQKLFELILKEAASVNLEPEQMIKKVLVFTAAKELDEFCDLYDADSAVPWETFYGAMQTKFTEKGYEMPHIVFWRLFEKPRNQPRKKRMMPGLTMVDGISDNLVKSLLDNNGEIDADIIMESDISGKDYQKLVVVD